MPVKVKPKVKVHLGEVRLFDKAAVFGRVRPAVTSGKVRVKLFRNGRKVASKWANVSRKGTYRTRLRVGNPGKYKARAVYGPAVLLTDRDATTDAPDPDPLALCRIARRVRQVARTTATRSRLLHPERRHELRLQDFRRDDRVQQGARQVARRQRVLVDLVRARRARGSRGLGTSRRATTSRSTRRAR